MSGVVEALREAAIAGRVLDLRNLGEGELLAAAAEVAVSPLLGDAVEALSRCWEDLDDLDGALTLVCSGIERNPDHLVLLHTVRALVDRPPPDVRRLVLSLDRRVRSDTDDLLRVEALAGVWQFVCLDDQWLPIGTAALLQLEDLGEGHAARRLCRLAALASEQFAEPSGLTLLRRLVERDATRGEAAYELGCLAMGDALSGVSYDQVAAGLRRAADWFAASEAAQEDARDAKLFRLSASALVALFEAREAVAKILVPQFQEAAFAWLMASQPAAGSEWLSPEPQTALGWIQLVDDIGRAAIDPSGGGAREVALGAALGSLSDLFSATRTIHLRAGEHEVELRPVRSAGFVEDQSLLARVSRWIASNPDSLTQAGRIQLRSTIAAHIGDSPPGKAREDEAERPAGVLEKLKATVGARDAEAVVLFVEGRTYALVELDDVERDLYESVRARLGGPDYAGEVRNRFDFLLLRLVKFLHSRMDHSPVGEKFRYLSAPKSGPLPKEASLQLDLYDFLLSAGYAELEKSHVASGRADIYIRQPGFRFVIEVKRTTSRKWSAFRLRPFLTQTGAYQSTDKRLGVLAVLDLSRRQPGDPHFLDCLSVFKRHRSHLDKRYVVVLRLPGNRRSPSDPRSGRPRGVSRKLQ